MSAFAPSVTPTGEMKVAWAGPAVINAPRVKAVRSLPGVKWLSIIFSS